MSIFSKVFLAITTFIANLWNSTKTEWNKLSPAIQADFTKVITWGNLIKGYVLNPSTAPGALDLLLTVGEAEIGPIYMAIINTALNEALIDAGIIQEALTDPKDAYNALITHLKSFGPNTVGDQVGVWVSNIVQKIVTSVEADLNNNQVKVIIAFVYDTFFKEALTTVSVQSPIASPVQTQASETLSSASAVDQTKMVSEEVPVGNQPAPPVDNTVTS